MRGSEPVVRKDSRLFAELCSALLSGGRSVRFRVNGESMRPNLLDGDDVTVAPAEVSELRCGDVVLTHGQAGLKAHRVAQVSGVTGHIITRGDAGQENDAPTQEVLGKILEADRLGKSYQMSGRLARLRHSFHLHLHRWKLASARRLKQIRSASALFALFVAVGVCITAPASEAQVLTITDSASPAFVLPGGTITYTEVLSNTSGATVNHNITVTQNVPANTTYVSAGKSSGNGTWTCNQTGGVVTCTDTANYANNNTTTFTVTVTVNAGIPAGTAITDTVTAKGANFTTGASASATVYISPADLALTQTVSPSVVAPGANYTYSEAVTNNGPTLVGSGTITVSTQTPANTNYQSYAGTNWTCITPAVGGTGNIVCTYNATLASGAVASALNLTMQVSAGATSGTVIPNSATVADSAFTDPIPSNNTSTSSITVEPSGTADLQLTQTAVPSTVAAGTNYAYTETVADNGPTAVTTGTTKVSTQTPANTTYQSYAGTNWTCTTPAVGGTGNIVCTYNAALAAGATANALTITLQVTTGTAAGTVITNSATVSNSTFTDPIASNNTSTTSITVATTGTADLQLLQIASLSVLAAGQNVTYTETVTDNGPTAATSGTITVYMQTPPNTNYQSYAGTNWTCTTPAVGGVGPVICTYNAALASGASASTLTATFQVALWAANTAYAVGTRIVDSNGNIEQVVSISGTGTSGATQPTWSTTLGGQTTDNAGGNQVVWQNAGAAAGTAIQASATVTNSTLVDPIPSNNTSITSVIVEPASSSDLGVSISVYPTPVFVSSNFTYTLTVQNFGQLNAPATSDVLSFTLQNGVTFVSYSSTSTDGSVWSCAATTSVSCSTSNSMAVGAVATIAITVSAPVGATTVSNTATVSLPGDPNSVNNSATAYTVVQPLACASPGRDGAGGTLTGVVNTYYPPGAAGTLSSASTTVTLGAAQGNTGKPITAGDLVLIIQMQDASINSTNTSSYGHGVPGDPASGSSSLGSSGLFEFVTATGFNGTTLTFIGTGPTGGLLNNYYYNAATATQGLQTYQVIRVPQYSSATLSSTLTALAWNGSVGGVLAVDVSSQLTLGGTVALDYLGFRGGGGITLTGTTNTVANTDYLTTSPANLPNLSGGGDAPANSGTNASKGEGIAGTPHWVAPLLSTVAPSSTALSTAQSVVEGLPNGSFARGAPGNAGGGGTDGDPKNNDYNSGGGAGANGGTGGQGGYGWNSMTATNSTDGGFGGTAFPASTSALVMGGGGGAGTVNNGTYYISSTNNGADCGTNCTGIFSSGGHGGGIAIIHAGSVVGAGTISANGESTLSTLNDSTGGGGAGGSILVFANSGALNGLTVSAVGGSAGSAWLIEAPGSFPGQRHGPGGGGGGGIVFLTAAPASSNVSGGQNGYTDTVQDSYGATPGQSGVVATTHVITETPGTQSGAYCGSADLSVTNSASPAVVLAGANITYTQTVTNNGPLDAVNAVFSETIPANATFQSISPLAGWTCATPAVGGTGNITCTNPDFAANASGTFTVVVQVAAATLYGTQIVDVDNITSGTYDANLANNSATAISTVGQASQADLAVINTSSSPTVVAGSNFTMTAVVTNNGPATAANLVFTEPLAANSAGTITASLVSITAPGWTCNNVSGTITCTLASLAAGVSANSIAIVETAPSSAPSGTVLLGTANIAESTTDPNYANNSSTASVEVATAGQADLAVSASGRPNPVAAGNNITYTQSVTNNGPTAITASTTAPATSVTFSDTIPANTTLASAFVAPANWTCSAPAVGASGTISCTLNNGQTLAVGAVVNFPLVVKVTAGTAPGSTITNSPSVSSSVSDPNTANNTATVTTIVASPTQSFVTISKTASPEPVNVNTNLTYTILVSNNGPAVAQGVSVSDPIPAQVTYANSSSSQGTCTYSSGTNTVSCSLGSLSVGSTAVITINVTATVFGSGVVTCNGQTTTYTVCNTASLTTTTSNPNPNTSSSAASTIQASTSVDLASFSAFQQPDGTVRMVWRTLEESRNLGFHVYREDSTGRHRLDPSLIAGSALVLHNSRPQHAAKSYMWVDPQPTPNASYWIEDVDINGSRTVHGPAYPEFAAASETQSQNAVRVQETSTVSPMLRQFHNNVLPADIAKRRPMTPLPVFPAPTHQLPSFSLADRPAVKIFVDQEGWYHVPFAQLYAAGLEPNTNPSLLHLYAEGVEQPLLVTGRSNGVSLAQEAIEFYGTPIDTPSSGTRTYWLVVENTFSNRISFAPPASSDGVVPSNFPFTVMRQDRTSYFAALLNGENNDNFFGDLVSSDPVDETLTVVHRDTSVTEALTLDLTLEGVTDQQLHSVSVQFNGANLGTFDFYGEVLASQSFSVDPSLAVEGTNNITLTALNGDNDVSLVQSVLLHYPHSYMADADWLRAAAPAGSQVQIGGFTNPAVRLFDITDTQNILELNGKITSNSGTYTISAAVPAGSPYTRTILAFAPDALSAPSSLAPYTPAFLERQRAGADIIIITHPNFASHLSPLVQLRSAQGYKVLPVTTDEIFDEFNYGERSPFAIQSFLQKAATHWQRKPQAVLLVGDASMDPRNYLGFGDFDFVPTRIIETAAFKTASDDWLTDFQQTGFGTIPIGRLPARTTADVDLMIAKIVGYEQGQSNGPWTSQALLIADQNVDANFSAAVTSAAATLPASLQTSEILTDGMDPSTAHTQILDALNSGALLVDYNGHGAEQQWSFADLFDNNDAAALTNGGRLPFYILIDCLNGLFQDVYAQSLSKALILAPNGGAVAVWASSGFTSEPPQASMDLALLHEIAANANEMLGLMVLHAKMNATDNDVRRTWNLLGDPAMRLHLPGSAAPSGSPAPASRPHPNPLIKINSPRQPCSPKLVCNPENQP